MQLDIHGLVLFNDNLIMGTNGHTLHRNVLLLLFEIYYFEMNVWLTSPLLSASSKPFHLINTFLNWGKKVNK